MSYISDHKNSGVELPSPSYYSPCLLSLFQNLQPDVWFSEVESQFTAAKATSQLIHHYCLVATLPWEIAMMLFNILSIPLSYVPYDSFKAAILGLSATQPANLTAAPFPVSDQLYSFAVAGGAEQNSPPLLYGQLLGTLQRAWKPRRHTLNTRIAITAVDCPQHFCSGRSSSTGLHFNTFAGAISATVNPQRDAHSPATGRNIAKRTSFRVRCRTGTCPRARWQHFSLHQCHHLLHPVQTHILEAVKQISLDPVRSNITLKSEAAHTPSETTTHEQCRHLAASEKSLAPLQWQSSSAAPADMGKSRAPYLVHLNDGC